MRLTAITCQKRRCMNLVRAGFRLCGHKNCGKRPTKIPYKGEEE